MTNASPHVRETGAASAERWFVFVLAAYAAYALVFIFRTSAVIDGVRYFALFDDEMVSMRYAANLIHHGELVWNRGERVEGFTNPLWVLFMAALHLLPLDKSKLSLPVELAGALFLVVNLVYVRRIADHVSGGSRRVTVCAVVFTASYLSLNFWGLRGTEVSLLTLVVSVCVWKLLKQEGSEGQLPISLHLLLATATLVRMDMAVPAGVILALGAWLYPLRRWRNLFVGASIVALFLAIQIAFRIRYYGDPLPNTYYLKLVGFPAAARIAFGALTAGQFAMYFAPPLFAVTIATPILRRDRAGILLSVFLGQLLYSIYVGGDANRSLGVQAGCASPRGHPRRPFLDGVTMLGRHGPAIVHHDAMAALILSVLGALRSGLRTRADLTSRTWLSASSWPICVVRRVALACATATERSGWSSPASGSRWADALVVVKPETVVRWHRAGFRLFWRWKSRAGASPDGGVSKETKRLIRQMAEINVGWGAPRIHGELLKLGIDIGERSVSRFMPPKPRTPPSQTWRTFLDNHVGSLASIDFFAVPTATFRVLYVFFVLAHDRRRVLHFNVTERPSATWTAQQVVEAFPEDTAPRFMIRDRDCIFGDQFRRRVQGLGIEEILTAPRSPWQNPYAERLVGSVRRECLDHVIVLGERHLGGILDSYFAYYHKSRAHLSLSKDPPEPRAVCRPGMGKIVELPEVAGLHHRYERLAA